MDRLDVQLFGKLTVRRNGSILPPIDAVKAQELFGYVALHGQRPHSRERLADVLWGENHSEHSRKYLRQALWQLQTLLHPCEAADGESLLVVDSVWVALNTKMNVVVDAAEMERAFHLVREIPGSTFDVETGTKVREAVALYQGELLEGWYHDWCILERERLQTMYLILLDKLLGYSEMRGEYESGIVYGHQILQVDRAREHTHRHIMRLYALSGDRTSALRQFQSCRAALREELDVSPTKRTVELEEQIRADYFPVAEPGSAFGYDLSTAPFQSSLDDVGAHLSTLRSTLNDVAEQLSREAATVHAYLRSAMQNAGGRDTASDKRRQSRHLGDAPTDTDRVQLPH